MSETGNGRKNWTRVVAAVGLVFLAVAGGIVLANANKVINKTDLVRKYMEEMRENTEHEKQKFFEQMIAGKPENETCK